jgi:hypothetical protein
MSPFTSQLAFDSPGWTRELTTTTFLSFLEIVKFDISTRSHCTLPVVSDKHLNRHRFEATGSAAIANKFVLSIEYVNGTQ